MKISTLSLTNYGRRYFALLLAVVFFHAGAAFADFNTGVAALKKNDYPAAFTAFKQAAKSGDVRAYAVLGELCTIGKGTPQDFTKALYWFRKGAAAGDANAMAQLANVYLRGSGVPKNLDKARQWALRSAAKGNAGGHFLAYIIATLTTLNPRYANGRKVDMAMADYLTSHPPRPAAVRAEKIDAYTHLAKAAEKDYSAALNFYLLYLSDHAAPENNRRFLSLFYRMRQAHTPVMPTAAKAATVYNFMQSKGASLSSAKLFLDTLSSARIAVLARYHAEHPASGAAKDKVCRNRAALVRLDVAQPLQGAVWLPLKDKLLKQTYLLKGRWKEKWTFAVCGERMPETVSFLADGGGGAYFSFAIWPGAQPAANQPHPRPAASQSVLAP
ncbi:MAG TPA: hypothetical protein DEP05_07435 [Betaproteobacteria bacterium]|nr:hypothetical protein [Betaproteobacteria bacterium]